MSSTVTDGKVSEVTETGRNWNKATYLGRSPQDTPAGWYNYVALTLAVVISAWPIYWMTIISTWDDGKISRKGAPQVIPGGEFVHNFRVIMGMDEAPRGMSFDNVDFGRSLLNTFVVVAIVTAGTLFFCSLAGFAFAKLHFKGRDPLLVFVVLTLTIPAQLGIVGAYLIHDAIGTLDTLFAVTVPALVSAFGVFYMRQYIEDSIPDELIESARVDGASTFRVYWNIVVPIIRPAMGVLGLITVIGTWNEYIWALIAVGGSPAQTIGPALHNLRSGQTVVYSIIFTGSFLATIPLILLLVVAGKQIVRGIMEGAVKA